MDKLQFSQNGIGTDLICFSHLRWDFVYQRPQHLMSRFAKTYRLFFIEEPVFTPDNDRYKMQFTKENVWVVTPFLQEGKEDHTINKRMRVLIDKLFAEKKIHQFISWYYTPMALKFSNHLQPVATVFDCMDELSAFKFAPTELRLLEAELLKKADVVFTGGHSLFQAKKHTHDNIYPFPSSIDKNHFGQARASTREPFDQALIPPVRIGFYGVIDERFNINLIEKVAIARPDWHLVLLGPVVKIDEADLPRLENIHYLGSKSYNELPHYLAGWDIAMIPFEKNESTKFISPTKTPEYLAGGKPVISSSIDDVVEPYGNKKLVHIADTAQAFIVAADSILHQSERSKADWLQAVDVFLADLSWDSTAAQMAACMEDCMVNEAQVKTTSGKFRSVA